MTPEMEMIVKRVGKDAIEVFNIAHHHSKGDPPCVCNVCQNCYDKISLWLRDHDAGVAVHKIEMFEDGTLRAEKLPELPSSGPGRSDE